MSLKYSYRKIGLNKNITFLNNLPHFKHFHIKNKIPILIFYARNISNIFKIPKKS